MRKAYFLQLMIFLCSYCAFSQQGPVDLYVTDTSLVIGEHAIVKIKVNNFTKVISFQASVNWDPSLMTFAAVDNLGLKDLGTENFGTTNSEKGHIRVVWEPQDAMAVSLADSTVLFTIAFEPASNEPREVEVHFQDNLSEPAFPVEIANGNYELLPVNAHSGTVSFYELITGLDERSIETIIYPNPFTESICIQQGRDKLDLIRVFSFSGDLVTQFEQVEEPVIKLQLGGLEDGFYFVHLKKGNLVSRKKLLKIGTY